MDLVCPKCFNQIDLLLPVEPLFTLEESAALIPMSLEGLRSWLRRHKHDLGEARYARAVRAPMRVSLVRMLTASEIRLIRDSVIRRLSVWRQAKMLLRSLRASG